MDKERPIVDNSDIEYVDIREVFGGKIKMLSEEEVKALSDKKENDHDTTK